MGLVLPSQPELQEHPEIPKFEQAAKLEECLSLGRESTWNNQMKTIVSSRILAWVAIPFSRGSSQPRSPALQVDSLPGEPQGKPKKTGVGSLSLLQLSFMTQESSWVSCVAGGFFTY